MLGKDDVEVLTAEVSVSVGGLDFEGATLEFEDGDIERSTAQVIDGHNVFTRLVHTVSNGGSGGLVDDTEHIETGDLSCIFRCLSLNIVEVGLGLSRIPPGFHVKSHPESWGVDEVGR